MNILSLGKCPGTGKPCPAMAILAIVILALVFGGCSLIDRFKEKPLDPPTPPSALTVATPAQ